MPLGRRVAVPAGIVDKVDLDDRSAAPTKEQLYNEAMRLGIEGRSKMDKTQLKRAVQRRKKELLFPDRDQ